MYYMHIRGTADAVEAREMDRDASAIVFSFGRDLWPNKEQSSLPRSPIIITRMLGAVLPVSCIFTHTHTRAHVRYIKYPSSVYRSSPGS